MGCDIHMYIEVRKNGKWELIKGMNNSKAWYYEQMVKAKLDDDKNYYRKIYEEAPDEVYEGWMYDGRNYSLFGILANVRGHEWPPIADPRGLPKDISVELQKIWDDCGEHTPSYHTLKNLYDYDFGHMFVRDAYVSEADAHIYRTKGKKPENWSVDQYADHTVKIQFIDTVASVDHYFSEVTIPIMENLMNNNKLTPEDVRIVFWFDS